MARISNIDIDVVEISDTAQVRDTDRAWLNLREVSAQGAILVRPDQHVGWRFHGGSNVPEAVLATALGRILKRDLISLS